MIWFNTRTQQSETDLCCLLKPMVCRRCNAVQKTCFSCYEKQDFMMQEQIRLGIWTCDACEPRDWGKICFILNTFLAAVNVVIAVINITRGHPCLAQINAICAGVNIGGAIKAINEPF